MTHRLRSPRDRGDGPFSFAVFRTAALAVLLAVVPEGGLAAAPGSGAVPGRVVVDLTPEAARALHAGKLFLPAPTGGVTVEPLFTTRTGTLGRFAVVTFDHPDPLEEGEPNRLWLDALRADPRVVRAQSDRVLAVSALPDDPYLTGEGGVPRQFHLHNPGGFSINAPRAWPFVPAGREVVVAIIDSGVYWDHPDLGGPVPPGGVMWVNAAENQGESGVDDDENGFPDDFIGWDFVNVANDLPGVSVHPAEDKVAEDNDPVDFAGHGTQVAGLITALSGNGVGLTGHPPVDIRLMPLRAGWASSGSQALVYMTYCARALEYAALNGARVANCSWDSDDVLGLGAALDFAIEEHDVVVVGSAGNNGSVDPSFEYLAMREDCLAVAALRENGVKPFFSNYGAWIDIAAFGVGMPSTLYDRTAQEHIYYVNPSGGTSFAAPIVSGAAAVLRAVDPTAGAGAIRNAIETTGRDMREADPQFGHQIGGGLLDLAAAARALAGGWDDPRPLVRAAALADRFVAHTGSAVGVFDAAAAPDSSTVLLARADTATGSLCTAWLGGEAAAVFDDGDDVIAASASGAPVSGWPAEAGGAVTALAAADLDGDLTDEIFVSTAAAVTVYDAEGAPLFSLPDPASAVVVGDVDPVSLGPEIAFVDTAGWLRVYDAAGAALPSWSFAAGGVSVSPVAVDFSGGGNGVVVLAGPEPGQESTHQRIQAVGAGTQLSGFPVTVASPGITALSVHGRAATTDVRVVAASADGMLFVLSGAGDVAAVDAGGPVVGEVVSADVDGSNSADLVVLRVDGVLLAFEDDGTPVEGFPRVFPDAGGSPPLVVDASGRRYIVVATEAAGTWSLPVGVAGTPMPWPGERGGGGRTGYLSFARATPVETASLTWKTGDGGTLCWGVPGAADLIRLRLRAAGAPEAFWTAAFVAVGCGPAGGLAPGARILLEGLSRDGSWRQLAAARIGTVPPVLLPAFPNPFRATTVLSWTGAADRIEIFDVRGRRVRGATPGPGATRFEWDGRDDARAPVAAGAYWIRLHRGGDAASARVVKLP